MLKLPPPLSWVGIEGRQEVRKGRHLFRSIPPTKCLESLRREQIILSFEGDKNKVWGGRLTAQNGPRTTTGTLPAPEKLNNVRQAHM